MKITQGMVDLMKALSIMASCQDTIDELREIYRYGLVELSHLSYDETLTPEQASAVLDFFVNVIRNEEARIENKSNIRSVERRINRT